MIKTQIPPRAKFIEKLFGEIEHRFDFSFSGQKYWEGKEGADFTSELDLEIDRFISARLEKFFPGEKVVSEESFTGRLPRSFWLVDPFDGTHNFLGGLKAFGVMIAFCQNQKVVSGGIFLPNLNEKWVGERKNGVWLNGQPFKEPVLTEKHFVFVESNLRQASLPFLKLIRSLSQAGFSIRITGCSASNFTFLAKTRGMIVCEAFRLWDVAAGVLLLQEAGAETLDLKGQEWTIGSNSLLAIHSVEKGKKKKLEKILVEYQNRP